MAGGLGSRMRSAMPKHLHPILGRRMVDWVVEAARPLGADPLVVVAAPDSADSFEGLEVAVQERPLGTGDAVRCARGGAAGADEVLVLSGDTPLLTTGAARRPATHASAARGRLHRALVRARRHPSVRPYRPRRRRRAARDRRGRRCSRRTARDRRGATRHLRLPGGHALARARPARARERPGRAIPHRRRRAIWSRRRARGSARRTRPIETEGVNTRVELAAAAAALRDRINERHKLAGVTIVDPATTWIEPTVELEPDTTILPFTVLQGATRVEAGARVGPHAVAVDAVIGPGALVGPFCYLRPGTVLGPNSKAGAFVELKNSRLGEGAKVPHLSYIGDAEIGERTNIGAGLDHRQPPPREGARRSRDQDRARRQGRCRHCARCSDHDWR